MSRRSLAVSDLLDLPDTGGRADEVVQDPVHDDHPLTEIDECPLCSSNLVGTVEVHDDDGVRLRAQCGMCPWRRTAEVGS